MSYTTISRSANDQALKDRVIAAVAQEAWNNPALIDNEYARNVRLSAANSLLMVWPIVTSNDVAAAYESAVAAGNENPGGDPAVITDGMILAAVQADWPGDPA